MEMDRRDFLKASAILGAALGLELPGLWKEREALAAEGTGLPMIWLQAQSCSGCSVSFLNSIFYTTVDDLLVNKLDVNYHPTVMAAAGSSAVAAANAARSKPGYILVVEGSIPTANNGKYCYLWPGTTAMSGVRSFARNAKYVIALGTCAAYGGMVAGTPNPTSAKGVQTILGSGSKVINIPGCPAHPDWLVGTIAYILANGTAPALDSNRRPRDYFGAKVHDSCPNLTQYNNGYARYAGHSGGRSCLECHGSFPRSGLGATTLGQSGCLFGLGCRGQKTYCDCPSRSWNGGSAGVPGVNWCIKGGSPCQGCTEPNFPDGMSPFFVLDGHDGGGDD